MDIKVLFCRKCGKEIPSDSTFCCYCGEKVTYVTSKPVASNNMLNNQKCYIEPEALKQQIKQISEQKKTQRQKKEPPRVIGYLGILCVVLAVILLILMIKEANSGINPMNRTASNETSTVGEKTEALETVPRTEVKDAAAETTLELSPQFNQKFANAESQGNNTSVAETKSALVRANEPYNGEILESKYVSKEEYSSITINTDSHAVVVKLKDSDLKTKKVFYVRAYSSVTVPVYTEPLYVYFASGSVWYGEDYLFGEDTYYSKDDEIQDFSEYTITYTLAHVTDGNFTETPIDASEF